MRLLLLLLIISSPLMSQIMKVERRGDATIVVGTSCESLNREMETLQKWVETTGEKPGDFLCQCNAISCEVDASEIMPKLLHTETNYCTSQMGPNCFNTALRSAMEGINHRAVEEAEFMNYMASPYCRELEAGEAKMMGDFILIQTFDQTLKRMYTRHVYVYITPYLTYSKDGPGKDQEYRLATPKEISQNVSSFYVGAPCRDIPMKQRDKSCQSSTTSFRCDFKAYKPTLSSDFEPIAIEVDAIACKASKISFQESLPEHKVLLHMEDQLGVLMRFAEQAIGAEDLKNGTLRLNSHPTGDDTYILKDKIRSLQMQIAQWRKIAQGN